MSENEGKQKKKGLWWKVLLGLFALAIVGSALGDSEEPSTTGGTQAPAQEVAQTETTRPTPTTVAVKKYGIGDAITVGEVTWVIKSAEKKDIIPPRDNYSKPAKPKGVFVVVSLNAELVGKESGSISGSQLKVVDSKNRKFEATDDYQSRENAGDSIIYEQVNPNVPIDGTVVFDIAKDSADLALEIGDLRMFYDDKGYVQLGL